MLHHYLQRGHKLNELLALTPSEKEFMTQCMILYYEEEAEKWKGLNGK